MNQKDVFQNIPVSSVENLKVKATIVRSVINTTLKYPISQPGFSDNVKKVSALVEKNCVPYRFKNVEIPNNNERFLSFKFVCLLAVFMHEIDRRREIGVYAKGRFINQITDDMVDKYPANKLLEALTLYTDGHFDSEGNPLYAGKLFAYYFNLEGIKCHINSFSNWSKQNPQLPKFLKAKYYTMDEFNQWRQFMLTKPGRKPPQTVAK